MQPANHCPGDDMSRWKYRTEDVTVGENTQRVRGMTAGERHQFANASKDVKEGKRLATDLPVMIAGFGCIEPPATKEEVEAMPSDLLNAVVDKIMEFSGMGKGDEKKAAELDPDLPTFPALDRSTLADPQTPPPSS